MQYENITWDDTATPIPDLPLAQPVDVIPDENGWLWYPDSNGQLFSLYFDHDGNECMIWRPNEHGDFYWRCANVGYNCRDIGIDGRAGIFFGNHFVGTMTMNNDLTVAWLPETYINQDQNNTNTIDTIDTIDPVNTITYINDIHINYNFTEVNNIDDTDDEIDDNHDE
jgi:hypothetical protein